LPGVRLDDLGEMKTAVTAALPVISDGVVRAITSTEPSVWSRSAPPTPCARDPAQA